MRKSSWTTLEIAMAKLRGERPDVQAGDTLDGRRIVRIEPTANWFIMHLEPCSAPRAEGEATT